MKPALYEGEQSWRAQFEQSARARGYEVEQCSDFDPAHGWTLLLVGGVEFEAMSAVDMTRKIERLPEKKRWYFTFGIAQPNAGRYYVVEHATSEEARAVMFAKFERLWAFQYDEVDWHRDGVSQAERYGLQEITL